MKYTVAVDLDLPRERVIELFDSTENLYKWQRGLKSFEHLSGEPGQPGARSKLVFQMGKRTLELLETITVRNLPDEFHATYEARGMHNIVRNRFVPLAADRTRWECENELQFFGVMKVMAFFMKGAFARQSLKYMQDFKAFAEAGRDVNAG